MRLVLFALLAMAAADQGQAGPLVEVYAAAIGGDTNGLAGCHTYGPPATVIGYGIDALAIPIGGIAACGFQGALNADSAAPGMVQQTASVAANFFDGNAYTGSARSTAQFGTLSVGMQGTMTAYSTGGRLRESGAFAAFEETFTIPGPVGENGFIVFEFDVAGFYSILPFSTYASEALASLAFKVNNIGSGFQLFRTYGINVALPFLPFVPVVDNWTKAGGSLKGNSTYRTYAIPFSFNTPFDFSVALQGAVFPCCLGASVESEFTARMTAITVTDKKGSSVGFADLIGGSGTRYTPNGPAIPEPATFALAAVALSGVILGGRYRSRRRL
jgi:hypothetical protein